MYRGQRHGNPNSTLFTQQDRADAAAHALRLESTNPESGEDDNYVTIRPSNESNTTPISQEDIDRAIFGEIEEGPKKEDLKVQIETTSRHELISVIDIQTGDVVLIKEIPIGLINDEEYDDFCEEQITIAFDAVLGLWHAEQAEKATFDASYASSLAAKALKKPARRRTRATPDDLIAANADVYGR